MASLIALSLRLVMPRRHDFPEHGFNVGASRCGRRLLVVTHRFSSGVLLLRVCVCMTIDTSGRGWGLGADWGLGGLGFVILTPGRAKGIEGYDD